MSSSSDKLKVILPNPDDYDKLVSELGRLPKEALYSGPRVMTQQLYAGVGEAGGYRTGFSSLGEVTHSISEASLSVPSSRRAGVSGFAMCTTASSRNTSKFTFVADHTR